MKSLFIKFIGTAFLAGVIAACSDGGSGFAGIGGSGYIATGSVTGFGSVFVNGVEFHTDSSTTYEIEDQLLYDQLQEQNYLSIGMVVQVEGSINSDGISGVATKIRYGDSLEGPITSAIVNPDGNELRFSVMGINVTAHATNTKFSGTDFNTLALNNLIEISGYYDQNSVLRATYIELKEAMFDENNHSVELEGFISGFNGSANFMVQGVNINASAISLTGLSDGKYVEVKGSYIGSVLIASEIESEDLKIKDDGSQVSIEGYITSYIDNSDFDVNGTPVDASGTNVEFEPLALKQQLRVGIKVEVEGNIIGGKLFATEVESDGGDAEVHATIEGTPTSNSFDLRIIATEPVVNVSVTATTSFEDDTSSSSSFGINDLAASDFVEVIGIETGINTITATKVKRRNADDIILQGYASAATGSRINGTITVLGVTFDFDGSTNFENENDATMSDPEVTALITGINTDPNTVLIKVKDTNGDGIAEEIDLED